MNKVRGDLSEKERELLMIRRASGAKASQLAQMEKMLQETKSMMEKKTETSTEKNIYDDTMVTELEEKVQRSKRERRNSLHRTQLLESQMKTVRGELVDTMGHLQALRDVLRRSQQKAEERQAAMEKLNAELR
ncbi:coiled-coil domain-containing protein 18 [Silurus meridionalis]|uniref:coiled-coil domain-containing protein 18 n=1 Tax=Silurus meridionalis TaxID=175797 RepID=UPI001EEB5249|nr:coiled-coil domain-containing protein 18 [Silurus meridionalis]